MQWRLVQSVGSVPNNQTNQMNDITIYPIFPFLCSHFPPKTIKKMEGKNHNSICALLKKSSVPCNSTSNCTIHSVLYLDISPCAAAEESETENSASVAGAVPHRTDRCEASAELCHPTISVCLSRRPARTNYLE